MQNRFKRCLPVCPIAQIRLKISPLQLGGGVLPVQNPPIRPHLSPVRVYQTPPPSCRTVQAGWSENPRLPGRLATIGIRPRFTERPRRVRLIELAVTGISIESQEMHHGADSINRVSGLHNRLQEDDPVLAGSQGRQDTQRVSTHIEPLRGNRSPVIPHNWSHDVSSTCHSPSPITLQSPSAPKAGSPGTEGVPRLRFLCEAFIRSSRRSTVVDPLAPSSQRTAYLFARTDTGSRVGRLQEGLGSPLQRERHIDRGTLDSRRITSTHQLARTKSSLPCHSNVCETSMSIFLDNQVAVAYINQMGGTHSRQLCKLAVGFWDWCMKRQITIHAEHLPGKLNVLADYESRHLSDCSDWKLNPETFLQLNARIGPFTIDLFASHWNKQVNRFFSWRPDPLALAVDALAHSWGQEHPYAFPPFALIGRCLQKVPREQTRSLLLIAPIWPAQIWHPLLLSMLSNNPVILPSSPDLLLNPQQEQHLLILNGHLTLAAWPISRTCSLTREFHRRVQTSSASPGGRERQNPMNPLGNVGSAGVTNGTQIPFLHLWQISSNS